MRIDDRPLRLDDLFLHQREPVLADLHRFVPLRAAPNRPPEGGAPMVADRRADASAPPRVPLIEPAGSLRGARLCDARRALGAPGPWRRSHVRSSRPAGGPARRRGRGRAGRRLLRPTARAGRRRRRACRASRGRRDPPAGPLPRRPLRHRRRRHAPRAQRRQAQRRRRRGDRRGRGDPRGARRGLRPADQLAPGGHGAAARRRGGVRAALPRRDLRLDQPVRRDRSVRRLPGGQPRHRGAVRVLLHHRQPRSRTAQHGRRARRLRRGRQRLHRRDGGAVRRRAALRRRLGPRGAGAGGRPHAVGLRRHGRDPPPLLLAGAGRVSDGSAALQGRIGRLHRAGQRRTAAGGADRAARARRRADPRRGARAHAALAGLRGARPAVARRAHRERGAGARPRVADAVRPGAERATAARGRAPARAGLLRSARGQRRAHARAALPPQRDAAAARCPGGARRARRGAVVRAA